MSRVMLFADFGKGPRTVGLCRFGEHLTVADTRDTTWHGNMSLPDGRALYLPANGPEAIRSATRWWIVVCRHADNGRDIIANEGFAASMRATWKTWHNWREHGIGPWIPPSGRILDSGEFATTEAKP